MCRLVGWCSATPLTAHEVLGDAALERLLHLSEVHCHGWGAAWQVEGRLVVRRSPAPAFGDPAFRDLLDNVSTTTAMVHIRMGTPGYGRRVVENHPFDDGAYAFAHNGAVLPPSDVDALLSPSSNRRPTGTTDSERIFLALLDELDGAPANGQRVAHAVAAVAKRAGCAGLHASSLNSMLLGPDGLFIINHHDRSWMPRDLKLWPDVYPPQSVSWPPYFDLLMAERDGLRVVTSSGVVHDEAGWTLLPNDSVLELNGEAVEVVDISPFSVREMNVSP